MTPSVESVDGLSKIVEYAIEQCYEIRLLEKPQEAKNKLEKSEGAPFGYGTYPD